MDVISIDVASLRFSSSGKDETGAVKLRFTLPLDAGDPFGLEGLNGGCLWRREKSSSVALSSVVTCAGVIPVVVEAGDKLLAVVWFSTCSSLSRIADRAPLSSLR